MKKPLWVLAAALTMPAVAVLGQQNSMSNGDRPNHESQSTHEGNHAMQSGSPNDNGAGLRGDYGNTQPGERVDGKHHHHRHRRSKKHRHEYEPNQTDARHVDEARPQPQ